MRNPAYLQLFERDSKIEFDNSPYESNGPMEAEANSDLREEAKRS